MRSRSGKEANAILQNARLAECSREPLQVTFVEPPFSLQSVCRNVGSTKQHRMPVGARRHPSCRLAALYCVHTSPKRCVSTSRPLGDVVDGRDRSPRGTKPSYKPGMTAEVGHQYHAHSVSRRSRPSLPQPSTRAKRTLRLSQPPIDRERCATVQRRRVRSWPEVISASQAENGHCTRHIEGDSNQHGSLPGGGSPRASDALLSSCFRVVSVEKVLLRATHSERVRRARASVRRCLS